MKSLLFALFFALTLAGCGILGETDSSPDGGPIDRNATAETKALFSSLRELMGKNLLFGHQDDLAYGVNWIREEGRSDIKEVAGSYPAVYGWELGDLEHGAAQNLDGVRFDDMQRWIRQGYSRGGVITISWHMDNPVSKGDAWDTTRAVYSIIPGGVNHELYKSWLDRFATFVEALKDDEGRPIPIIFRPFHEHSGSWFWWGGKNTNAQDYTALWRFTVEYLRDEKKLHNLLYSFSTDVFSSEQQYLAYYPGDGYVDVLGYDDYQGLRSDEAVPAMTNRLVMLTKMADARGKIAAMTESGLEGCPDPDMWTTRLLRAFKADPAASRAVYVVMWRNAPASQKAGHFYAPYPGQASAADFVAFTKDPYVLLEDELPDLYD